MADQTFVDCERLFDHIDDLIEFPSVDDTSLTSFTDIWTTNSDTNCLSTLSSLPYEDIVQLEWLSNFVEESFSGGGMTINTDAIPVKEEPLVVANYQFQMASPVSVLESSSSSSSSSSCSGSSGMMIPMDQTHRGPQRARNKRPRPPAFNPRAAIELLYPSNLISVPVSSIESDWSHVECLNGLKSTNVGPDQKKRKKKPKKLDSQIYQEDKPEDQNQNQTGQGVRKCMHCEITKTPQWRAGPMGPKTLCNACGVRYKSGRLFPEYRPAASPTFVPTIHSNSHKKVVEMRTKFMPNDIIIKPEPKAHSEHEPSCGLHVIKKINI